MATQDDYIKTALRLPRELHSRLLKAAQETSKSMNAEIVARLDTSFGMEVQSGDMQKTLNDLMEKQGQLQKTVEALKISVEASMKKGKK